MRNFKPGIILLLNLMLYPVLLYAELDVNISLPVLNDDLYKVEEMLNSYIGDLMSDFEIISDDIVEKPKLTGSFANSSSLNRSVFTVTSLLNSFGYSFYSGISSSLFLPNMDFDNFLSATDDITPEEDYSIGANADIIRTGITIPGAAFGFTYLDTTYNDINFKSIAGSISGYYSPFRTLSYKKIISWVPIRLGGGLSYGYNYIGTTVKPGLISEEFDIDPDGDGPLLPQIISIEVDPEIDISLESYCGAISIIGATGFSILETLSFLAGGGFNLQYGESHISIYSSEEIKILGYISNFITTPARITLSGDISPAYPEILMPYIFGLIEFNVSNFYINGGILIKSQDLMAVGVNIGVLL